MRSRLVIPAVLIVTAAYMKGRRDGRLEYRPEPLAPPEPATPVSPLMDPAAMAQALAADAVELAEAQTAASGATLIVPRAATPAPDPDAEWEDPFASPDLRTASEWVAAPASRRPAPPAEDDALDLAISTEWATNLATAAPPAEEPEIAFAAEFTPEFEAEFTPEDESESEGEPQFSIEVSFDETGRFSLGGFATQAGHIALAGITFRERRSGLVDPRLHLARGRGRQQRGHRWPGRARRRGLRARRRGLHDPDRRRGPRHLRRRRLLPGGGVVSCAGLNHWRARPMTIEGAVPHGAECLTAASRRTLKEAARECPC